MKKNIVVIGLGRFGSALAIELAHNNTDVLAIDSKKEVAEAIVENVTNVAICDASNKHNLEELGVASSDHAIVAIGNDFEATMITTIHLLNMKIPRITVRIQSRDYIPVFKALSDNIDIIIPEESAAFDLANRLTCSSLLDFYNIKGDYATAHIKVGQKFKSKTLQELKLRQKYEISISAIIRDKDLIIPQGTDYINSGDLLLVLGHKKELIKFSTFIGDDD